MAEPRQKAPAETVLDVAVYAPLGLALTIAESFPQLVRKGRSRLGPQIALARSVGQFAVHQGARQLKGMGGRAPFPFSSFPRFSNFPASPFRPHVGGTQGGRGAGAHARQHDDDGQAGDHDRGRPPAAGTRAGSLGGQGGTGSAGRAGGAGSTGSAETGHDPSTDAHLAIPSYDSLSASQVVQRLAGLSRDEVEAVRAYEARTRGRRTILARAEQLLA